MAVGCCDLGVQRDAFALCEQRAFRAALAPAHRRPAGRFTAAGGLDDASVHHQILQLQAHDPVIGLQGDVLQVGEDSCFDPLVPAPADGGRRTGAVGDIFVGGPEHEDLDELVEHHPVGRPRPVAAQRVGVRHGRDQRLELVPDGFDDG